MTTEQLMDWARENIRMGRFAPGQRLIESDIIRETHASRNKVRDALQRLATEGLVTIEQFRGASVKLIGRDEVRQMYEARMAIEGFAARRLACADNHELKKKLRQTQEDMNEWVERGDHERFARLNSDWHALIIKGAGNEYFQQFLLRLTIPIYRLLFSSFYAKDRITAANNDHKKITEAIIAGKADEAESLMRDHIANGLRALSEIDAHIF
jgi:DNA-binding GntR family transcriptional regulator